ncbi:MAG: fibronectin type III domain-containing protein, partial [Elusimicrobiota bacterium]
VTNTPPAVVFTVQPGQSASGGYVTFTSSITYDQQDACRLLVEYSTSGAGGPWVKATISTLTATVQDAGGSPVIDNSQAYQIGNIAGRRIVTSAANPVQIVWVSTADIQGIELTNTLLRLTANDTQVDSSLATSNAFTADNKAPVITGTPAYVSVGLNSVTVSSATATDGGSGLSSWTLYTSSDNATWVSSSTPVNQYSLTATGLPANVTTYAKVIITDSYGNTTGFSSTVSTHTLAVTPSGTYTNFVSSASITVGWTANGNPSYTRWGLLRSIDNFTSTTTLTGFSLNYQSTSYVDGSVSVGTTYWYKVQAFNEDGIGTTFDVTVTTVTNAAPSWPGMPTGVSGTALSTSVIQWSWTAGANAAGHRVKSASDNGNLSGDLGSGVTFWTQTGLSVNSSTSVYVEAFNIYGSSASASVTRYTLAAVPGATSIGTVLISSVQVSWADTNPAGTQYSVEASTGNNASYGVIWNGTGAGPITHSGLNANTTYYYKVKAQNGDGLWTNYNTELSTHTLAATPGVAAFTGISSTTVRANWTANGNSSETKYYCEGSSVSSSGPWTLNSGWLTLTIYSFDGLLSNTTYYFRVKASNQDNIDTLYTDLGSAVTLVSPPTAPSGLYGIALSTYQINWNWTASPDANGHRVRSAAGANEILSGTLSATATYWVQTVPGVNVSTSVYVEAFNGTGYSVSLSSSKYTLAMPPTASLFSAVYISSITVTWSANGNPAGTQYTINYSTDAGFTTPKTVSATVTNYTIASLDYNTIYYVQVMATNGDGVATAYDTKITTATLANIPANTQVASTGADYANLTWFANGNPAGTTYRFERSTAFDFSTGLVISYVVGTSSTSTGMAANTTYYFRVAAVNVNSIVSPYDSAVNSSIANQAPDGFALISPADDSIVVKQMPSFDWADATDPDVGDILKYELWVSTLSDFSVYSASAGLTVSAINWPTSLIENATYWWKVKVTDNKGASNWSTQVWTLKVNGVSEAPVAFNLTTPADGTIFSTRTVTVTWSSSTDVDPGDSVKYILWYSNNSGFISSTTVSDISVVYYTLTALPDDTYYWKVGAVDSTGLVTVSNQTTYKFVIAATDKNPPAPITTLAASQSATEGAVNLTWLSPGNDGTFNSIGSGSKYLIQYSSYAVTWSSASAQVTVSVAFPVSPNTLQNWAISSLIPGTTYIFYVWTVDETGNVSPLSNGTTAYATDVTPSKPSKPVITIPASGAVKLILSWTANPESDIKQYQILKGNASGLESILTTITGTYYEDVNVFVGTMYYYQIKAIDNAGNISIASDESSASPGAPVTGTSVSDDFSGYTNYYEEISGFESMWSPLVQDTTNYKEGNQGMKLTETSTTSVYYPTTLTLSSSSIIRFWAYVTNAGNITSLKLLLSNHDDFSKSKCEFNVTGLQNGWNAINMGAPLGNKSGSFDWASAIYMIRYELVTTGTAGVTLDDLKAIMGANTTGGVWQEQQGIWSVTSDKAYTPNKTYLQSDESRSNMNLLSGKTYYNYTQTARVRINRGSTAGLGTRMQDPNLGYTFTISSSGIAGINVDGSAQGTSTFTYSTDASGWITMRFSVNGTLKRGYLLSPLASESKSATNYYLVCEENTSVSYTNGYVGLYTYNSMTEFDDVRVIVMPESLAVTSSENNSVTLAWTIKNTNGIDGFKVYRSSDGISGTYYLIRSLNATMGGVTESGLTNGVTYYYRVTSYDTSGYESDWAGPVKAVPYEVINPDTISGKVTLKEIDGTPIAAVKCEALLSGQVVATVTTLQTGEYALVGLTPNTTYTVRVTYYEGEKAFVVYREVKSGTGHVVFTLNLNYILASISGRIANYKPKTSNFRLTTSDLKDPRVRAKALSPESGAGFVEIWNVLNGSEASLKVPLDDDGRYEVKNLLPGKYAVRGFNGTAYSAPAVVELKEGETLGIVLAFALLDTEKTFAYPNPATGGTLNIQFYSGVTTIEKKLLIFNIAGELVREVKDSEITSAAGGIWKFSWNCQNDGGSAVASGVYLYVLEVKNTTSGETSKVVKKFAIIR